MAELADAADSKSAEVHPSWGFNSPSRHHMQLFRPQGGIPTRFVSHTGGFLIERRGLTFAVILKSSRQKNRGRVTVPSHFEVINVSCRYSIVVRALVLIDIQSAHLLMPADEDVHVCRPTYFEDRLAADVRILSGARRARTARHPGKPDGGLGGGRRHTQEVLRNN